MTATELYEQPASGPHRPLPATPPRRPASARRTTTADTRWPASFDQPIVMRLRGRDLVTDREGASHVAAELALTLTIDVVTGAIVTIDGDAPVALDALVGANVRAGFGRHLVAQVPEGEAHRALWYAALDDLPGAFLVSGFAGLRSGLLGADPLAGGDRADRQADICIGWRVGGPVHNVLAEHGRSALPIGPPAPAIEGTEPDAWHELDALAPHSVRRRRQVDVWRSEEHPGRLAVQSHFRDSYLGDEPETVMHEYLVEATVDERQRIAALDVDARVLPWVACPGAVASATAMVGVGLEELSVRVRAELTGNTTCTHLNSTLRALADVRALAAQLA